ncbi:MAG: hypothetical protein M3Y85_00690 [Bacteroidota bacterium]|nr:hypothetical protein [Bacteroidota bacterium]
MENNSWASSTNNGPVKKSSERTDEDETLIGHQRESDTQKTPAEPDGISEENEDGDVENKVATSLDGE